jgi:hypothetical protein
MKHARTACRYRIPVHPSLADRKYKRPGFAQDSALGINQRPEALNERALTGIRIRACRRMRIRHVDGWTRTTSCLVA